LRDELTTTPEPNKSQAGLLKAVVPAEVLDLERPTYSPDEEVGTRLYNGHRLRRFNLDLALLVECALNNGQFPLVVGGDCSVLLGALAGARRAGPLSLVHLDGHSDFRHPGNYDVSTTLGAVAGMDLALVTGRGEALLTEWPGLPSPLVPDEQVVQIGERDGHDPNFAWPDINETAITRIDVFSARKLRSAGILKQTRAVLDQAQGQRFWVHFDVDVLDQTIMPAVDAPGNPGIELDDVTGVLKSLIADSRCCGMTMTIFDPSLDPTGELATLLVRLLQQSEVGSRSGRQT
jgi:arginase